MHYRRTLTALTALAIGLSSTLAGAQPRGPDRDDRRSEHSERDRRDDRDRHDRGDRHADLGRGAGPDHRWHRGDRLAKEYRSRHDVVNDWRAHRLHAPPRGYQWVQVGADFALIAVATGIITQIVLAR